MSIPVLLGQGILREMALLQRLVPTGDLMFPGQSLGFLLPIEERGKTVQASEGLGPAGGLVVGPEREY